MNTKPNGCYNRAPLKESFVVQSGYFSTDEEKHMAFTRRPLYLKIPNALSKECQYSILSGSDPRCAGCCHNQTELKAVAQ